MNDFHSTYEIWAQKNNNEQNFERLWPKILTLNFLASQKCLFSLFYRKMAQLNKQLAAIHVRKLLSKLSVLAIVFIIGRDQWTKHYSRGGRVTLA